MRRLIGLFCLALLGLWFLVPPPLPTGPLKLVRGADGNFTSETDSRPWINFQVQLGGAPYKQGGEFSVHLMQPSRPERARLACRSVLVRCASDHLLARRTADELVKQLEKLPYLESIELFRPGRSSRPVSGRPISLSRSI